MGNNIKHIIFLFIVYFTSYSQIDFKEKYIELSQFENEEYLNGNFKNGNFYLIKRKNNEINEIQNRSYRNNKKHGKWLVYSKTLSGFDLISVCHYNNDKFNGYFYLTNNHTESKEGYYSNGKKHGLWQTIKTSGGYPVISKGCYKNDKKHGKWIIKESIHGGEIIIEGEYKKGKKDGLWTIKNSTILIINTDGLEKTSLENEYYQKGKLIKRD